MLDERVIIFKFQPVNSFEEHRGHGLYTIKNHLPHGKDLKKCATVPVIDTCPYEHFHAHFKNYHSNTLRRRLARMMETANILQRLRKGSSIVGRVNL